MGALLAPLFRPATRRAKAARMATAKYNDNLLLAVGCILAGVALASSQDAIVKSISGGYPAYEALMLRCIGSIPILGFFIWRQSTDRSLFTPLLGRIFIRGLILGLAYLCFVLAIAAIPIANAVAIYFTMPFFVAGLAGPLLGERVRLHRWMAIIAGFIGVLTMVRPDEKGFEPASIFALLSAMGYAVGQMIGRPLAQDVSPIVIAVWQNVIYFAIGLVLAIAFNVVFTPEFTHPSLVFLTRPLAMPAVPDLALMLFSGVLAAFGMLLFVNAYKYGEASFVAPFEYSAMIWAVFYGLVLFGDFPDAKTWMGAAIVITAGLYMVWRDRQLNRAGR
jgi:drug/metabolite transporter (DMT)-like permease